MEKIECYKINNEKALIEVESRFRNDAKLDYYPWANNTSYSEIVKNIFPDKKGRWSSPLYLYKTIHNSSKGANNVLHIANDFLNSKKENANFEILSLSASINGTLIILISLIRVYDGQLDYKEIFEEIGEDSNEPVNIQPATITGRLIIPDEIKNYTVTEEQRERHQELLVKQQEVYNNTDNDKPFLNELKKFEPTDIYNPVDDIDLIYDLKTADMQMKIIATYNQFTEIFNEILSHVNGVEYYHYVNVIAGEETEEFFMQYLEQYLQKHYIDTGRLNHEDASQMLNKLHCALFKSYIIQDLIDDEKVSDIIITAPDCIIARVNGKDYRSNIHFIDVADYRRFMNALAIRNKISLSVPQQTVTDNNDKRFIMRITINSEYVNSADWDYCHIRKISREIPTNDIIVNKKKMMPEIVKDYLLDCGRHSRGVVFAGPPGSGKTTMMNWFINNAYEHSAEVLVIQESEELFSNNPTIRFQHVVEYPGYDQAPVNLEELGRLGLVNGANVFVIGEAKGAEICSALTIANSGCRSAITIHSSSSTETVDKMADLALRGYKNVSFEQAKRMVKAFQTIVYMENYKIQEISEIIGYDEKKHDMIYKCIYRRVS